MVQGVKALHFTGLLLSRFLINRDQMLQGVKVEFDGEVEVKWWYKWEMKMNKMKMRVKGDIIFLY